MKLIEDKTVKLEDKVQELQINQIIDVSETELDIMLIGMCTKAPAMWEQYQTFWGVVDMYKDAGARLEFFYNVTDKSYTCVPYVKNYGFK